jgi:hypothetical protein
MDDVIMQDKEMGGRWRLIAADKDTKRNLNKSKELNPAKILVYSWDSKA